MPNELILLLNARVLRMDFLYKSPDATPSKASNFMASSSMAKPVISPKVNLRLVRRTGATCAFKP
jgi:hypothetical protein